MRSNKKQRRKENKFMKSRNLAYCAISNDCIEFTLAKNTVPVELEELGILDLVLDYFPFGLVGMDTTV